MLLDQLGPLGPSDLIGAIGMLLLAYCEQYNADPHRLLEWLEHSFSAEVLTEEQARKELN